MGTPIAGKGHTSPLTGNEKIPLSPDGFATTKEVADLGTGGGGLTTLTLTYNGRPPFDVQAVTPLGYNPAVGGMVAFIASSLPILGTDFGPFFIVATVNSSGVITSALFSSPATISAFDGAANSAPFVFDGQPVQLAGGAGGVIVGDFPNTDPHVFNQLWDNGDGIVRVSHG